MDQIGVNTLRSVQKLLKAAIKTRILTAFPNLPNQFDVQIETVTNQLQLEYKTPTVIRIFNQFKKQNLFGGNMLIDLDVKTQEEIAEKIAAVNCQDQIIKKVEAIEKGYLTIQLDDSFIEQEVNQILKSGLKFPLEKKQKVVIDFSSPNIAKEMHVGHLRSTILGESLCRILEFQGQEVVRVNHVGDWGTQFGMLINYLLEKYPDYQTNKPVLKELEDLYKEAKKRFDVDADFKQQSQLFVVKLQALDPQCIDAWKMICELSRQEFNKIYSRLNVKNTEYGESYYNPMLATIVQECEAKGIVEVDQGAKIIRVKGEKVPLMIVKKDGGYNYDTTDMAAAKTRIIDWKCDRLLYLTDVGQYNHFKLVFEGAKMMGWHKPPQTSMEHMGFGLVLGPDGKKFKTRSGDTVKLIDLLDEAKERALKQIQQRVADNQQGKEFATGSALSPEEYEYAAEKMGIAAIKYYDLKQNRISDYNFDYDKMLDPKGNTAVYLMYSYVRIVSILRKSGIENIQEYIAKTEFKITHPHERHLAAQLLRFVDVLQSVGDQLSINWLCDYIYDICVKISEAYQQYRILNDENTATRVLLCEAVRVVLLQCFYLVGIEPIEKI